MEFENIMTVVFLLGIPVLTYSVVAYFFRLRKLFKAICSHGYADKFNVSCEHGILRNPELLDAVVMGRFSSVEVEEIRRVGQETRFWLIVALVTGLLMFLIIFFY